MATSSNVAKPVARHSRRAVEGSESDDSLIFVSGGPAMSSQRHLREDVMMSGSQADIDSSTTSSKKRKRTDSDGRGGGAQCASGVLSSGTGRVSAPVGSAASSTPSSNSTIRSALGGGAPATQPAAQVDRDPLASVQASLNKLNMSTDVVRAKCTSQEWIDSFDEVYRKVRT